jgi:hypothetical protein
VALVTRRTRTANHPGRTRSFTAQARASRPPVTGTSICDHCPHMRSGHRVRTGAGECKAANCGCPGFSYERHPEVDRQKVAHKFLTEEQIAQGKAMLDAGLTYHEVARKLGNMSWESSFRKRFPEFKKGRPATWDTQVLGADPDQEGDTGE